MEYKFKLITVVILALLTGTTFAAPLLIAPLDVKPYPHVSEGPKADFSIDLLYANFTAAEWAVNKTSARLIGNFTTGNYSYVNVTETVTYTNVTYSIVANITNLSDFTAKMYESSFAAAEDISIKDSVLGGKSFNSGYNDRGSSFGGVVEGLWFDGKWLDKTWIPGTDYPFSMFRVMNQNHASQLTIPEVPENATEEGTWIEGVPVAEYYDSTHLTATQIYINGAWVDVTGRVQPSNPQPMVMATNTLADLILTSSTPIYKNVGNASVGPITDFPSWGLQFSTGIPYRWTGIGGFNSVWAPHESKLIIFNGTETFSDSEGLQSSISALESGKIDIYASMTSLITNMPINGTYYNTVSTATWLNTVPLEKTSNGYIYNAILADNQVFQVSPNGIEVSIEQEN